MGLRNKLIGFILILLGVWPFLLKIDAVEEFFSSVKFLEMLTPGEVVFQVVLIILGILLIWRVRPREAFQERRH
jgi:hypothetical protein